MTPDLSKLRRFALSVGGILLLYLWAGITIRPDSKLTIFGLDFMISNKDVIDLTVLFVSIYGALRYYYFAYVVHHSPARIRNEMHEGTYRVSDLNPIQIDERVKYYFPKQNVYSLSGEGFVTVRRQGLTAKTKFWYWLGDIDYAAPFFINLLGWIYLVVRPVAKLLG